MPDIITTPFLARVQTDPQGASPTATAFFGETTTINGKTYDAPWTSVSWSLFSDDTVTLADGTELTYAQISEGVTLIAYAARAAALAAAAPAPAPVEEPAEEPAPEVDAEG